MSDLALAWRIARRELRGGLRGFYVFLACLALGVAAIAAVGSVRESIRAGLEEQGASLLGGDAAVELTYRFATSEERAFLESQAQSVSEIVDFRSMAVTGEGETARRGLAQVKAVDNAYPLYGSVELDPQIPLADAFEGQDGRPGAVMDPVLIARLALNVGDVFRLGTQEFVLMAGLIEEPDAAGAGFSLGPRIIVQSDDLTQSGLLAPGTLFNSEYRLKLDPDTPLDQLRADTEAEFGPGLRWRDRRNGAPGVAEFVTRLGAFLVLVGLAGLAVGGVGVSAAVRAYLEQKTPVIATLKTLGAGSRLIFQTYFLQIGVLALLGIALGLALGALVPLIAGPLIEARLPLPASIGFHPRPLGEAAIYGFLAALLFTLWPLARTEELRAAALYRDNLGSNRLLPRTVWLIVMAGILALLIAVAAWFSGMAQLTIWAAAGMGGAFLLLLIAGFGIRHLARVLARIPMLRGRTALRGAFASVGGPGREAQSVVLSLGLGLSVLAAVGQIDSNLRRAIADDLPERAPAFFAVDIQNAQMEDFRTLLEADPAVDELQNAPMLRGIITEINGRPAAEVAGPHWVLEGDRGITYSTTPPAGTVITQGEWWPADYTGPAQISFSAEEGLEMGLKLGDRLTINVLGRDLGAEITSFREVDFSSAGIGFILSMNPAALVGAPHSHIATIYADADAEAEILAQISERFPNVTAISVRETIDQVSSVLGSIAAAVTYGALAALLTGAIVLIGAAAAGERARAQEAAILKTLGATRRSILTGFGLRALILGAAAGLVAVFAGAMGGWAVSRFVMETDYSFAPVSALIVIVGGILLTVIAGAIFSLRPLAARPACILRASE